MILPIE